MKFVLADFCFFNNLPRVDLWNWFVLCLKGRMSAQFIIVVVFLFKDGFPVFTLMSANSWSEIVLKFIESVRLFFLLTDLCVNWGMHSKFRHFQVCLSFYVPLSLLMSLTGKAWISLVSATCVCNLCSARNTGRFYQAHLWLSLLQDLCQVPW